MQRIRIAIATVLLFAAGAASAAGVTYRLDPGHTLVLASWDHFGWSTQVAAFGEVDGTLVYDADDVAASRVDVTLPMSGLDALVPKLTAHLRSADFFDADTFPTARFRSTQVEDLGGGKLKIAGELTLRGVTRPVVLDAKLNKAGTGRNGQPQVGFDATGSLLRSAFGIDGAIPGVSDRIELRISTEAHAVADAPAQPAAP